MRVVPSFWRIAALPDAAGCRARWPPAGARRPGAAGKHPVARPAADRPDGRAADRGRCRSGPVTPRSCAAAKNRGRCGRGSSSGPSPQVDAINPPTSRACPPRASTPPDSTGAIGPSHYIEMVNSQVAVYSRASARPRLPDRPRQLRRPAHQLPLRSADPVGPAGEPLVLRGARLRRRRAELPRVRMVQDRQPDPAARARASAGNWCRFAQSTGSVIDDYPKLGHERRAHRDRQQRVPGQQLPHGQDLGIREAARGRSELRHAAGFSFGSSASPLLSADGGHRLHPRAGSGRRRRSERVRRRGRLSGARARRASSWSGT